MLCRIMNCCLLLSGCFFFVDSGFSAEETERTQYDVLSKNDQVYIMVDAPLLVYPENTTMTGLLTEWATKGLTEAGLMQLPEYLIIKRLQLSVAGDLDGILSLYADDESSQEDAMTEYGDIEDAQATDELVENLAPDHIIIATGSEYIVPNIKGIEKAHHATAVYFDPEFEAGDRVVIVGGGLVGVECGLHLASLGKKVTVIEILDKYAIEAVESSRYALIWAVEDSGMEIITGAKTTEIQDSGVVYEKNGETVSIDADTVLFATGMRPTDHAYFDFYSQAPFISLIGDANRIGKVDGAVYGGFFTAMDI